MNSIFKGTIHISICSKYHSQLGHIVTSNINFVGGGGGGRGAVLLALHNVKRDKVDTLFGTYDSRKLPVQQGLINNWHGTIIEGERSLIWILGTLHF